MKRVLSLVGPAAIALGLGLQLSSWHGERVRREAGYPGLDLLRSWGCTDGRLLRWSAEPSPRRRLHLPADWPRRSREAPALLVFLDGTRLLFLRNISVENPSGVAYYERTPARGLDLIVACPDETPCGTVEVIPEDRGFDACVARARLVERPSSMLGLAVAVIASAVLSWFSLRGAWASMGGVLAAVLITWFGLRLYRSDLAPWLLLLQATVLGTPPVLRLASRLSTPTKTLLGRWEDRLAALESPRLARRGAWVASLLAAALAAPLAYTKNAYQGDWSAHLHYVERQLASLREGAWPSPFLHVEPYGAFYPYFAFYAGPLHALTAGLGLVLSSACAYKLTYAGAFAISYLGSTWWARIAGVRGAFAHAVGLLSISSAYWLSLAYGKGAWGEFIASSVLPFVLAACTANARSPTPTRGERAALLAGWLLLSGSHTLTLIWGGVFTGAYALGLVLSFEREHRLAPLLRILPGVLLGIGLNGWFLGPLLAYAPFTRIADYSARGFGTNNPVLDSLEVVFHPGRYLPAGIDAGSFVQVSVYALTWAVAAGACSVRRLERRERLAFGLALLGAMLFLSLLTQGRAGWFWRLAPDLLRAIQFPPRLHVYLSLCVLALVVLGLRSLGRSPHRRLWSAAFLVALGAQLGLAAYQVRTAAPTGRPITEVLRLAHLLSVPRDYRHEFDYRFATRRDGSGLGPEIDAPARLALDLTTIHGHRAEVVLPAGHRGPFATNVSFSPLIRTRGNIVLLGRTRDGLAVIAPRSAGAAPLRGTLEPAWPWPRLAGVAMTTLALVGSFLFLRPRNVS